MKYRKIQLLHIFKLISNKPTLDPGLIQLVHVSEPNWRLDTLSRVQFYSDKCTADCAPICIITIIIVICRM